MSLFKLIANVKWEGKKTAVLPVFIGESRAVGSDSKLAQELSKPLLDVDPLLSAFVHAVSLSTSKAVAVINPGVIEARHGEMRTVEQKKSEKRDKNVYFFPSATRKAQSSTTNNVSLSFFFSRQNQLLPSLSRGLTLTRPLSDKGLVRRYKRDSFRWAMKQNVGGSYAKRTAVARKKSGSGGKVNVTSVSASTKRPRGDNPNRRYPDACSPNTVESILTYHHSTDKLDMYQECFIPPVPHVVSTLVLLFSALHWQ